MAQTDFVSFFDAMSLLAQRLGEPPSNEEFWMWCFEGKELGGLDAYMLDGNDYSKVHAGGVLFPTRRNEYGNSEYILSDLVSFIEAWHFLYDDIQEFLPQRRYITGKQLADNWSNKINDMDKVKKRIQVFSAPLPAFSDSNNGQPPKLHNYYPGAEFEWENGLGGVYLLEDVIAVENYCHIAVPQTKVNDKSISTNQKRDDDFQSWMDCTKPTPALLEMYKADIQSALMKREGKSHLWASGFSDWWKYRKDLKCKRGRPKGS